MKKILVGTDSSAAADLAVKAAADMARLNDAELLVLLVRAPTHAFDAADPKKAVDPDGYLASMTVRFPEMRVRAWSEAGDPAERLCEVAADECVDAIVVGNKGVKGPRWRVREAVPTMVVRHAPCSVFIIDTREAQ